MIRTLSALLVLALFLTGSLHAAEGKYTVKEMAAPPPKELKEIIKGLLEPRAAQVFDARGELYCEIWFAKAVPSKATPAQVQNGLTYRELEHTSLVGAIRFAQDVQDYRKQDVKAGVYTLRVGHQPQDGDHMGTAPHPEFCLLVSANLDDKPEVMEPKKLHDISARSLEGGHPGVFLLFPNKKPDPQPAMVDLGMGHWALRHTLQIEAGGKKVPLGISLNLAGHSPGA
jgi:hypothetical protein